MKGTDESAETGRCARHGAGAAVTGAEYLDSPRNGREVYIYGERVNDVTGYCAVFTT